MSDDKKIVQLSAVARKDYTKSPEFIGARDRLIDDIKAGKSYIIITIDDDDNDSITYITDCPQPYANATIDRVKWNLLFGTSDA